MCRQIGMSHSILNPGNTGQGLDNDHIEDQIALDPDKGLPWVGRSGDNPDEQGQQHPVMRNAEQISEIKPSFPLDQGEQREEHDEHDRMEARKDSRPFLWPKIVDRQKYDD